MRSPYAFCRHKWLGSEMEGLCMMKGRWMDSEG
jgi:hypothetical protein